MLFDRGANRFTDKYEKDVEMYNGDVYAAKWLTRVCYPDMLPRKAVLSDTPEIRTVLGMVDWSELNFSKTKAEEIF